MEHAEKLEQLRWLQAGLNIKVGITTTPSYGVDTMDDLIKVRELIQVKIKSIISTFEKNKI